MILKAKERGNAPQLASYLLSMRENEHVELYQMRGFVSDDLKEAFAEAEAIASATKCKKHLFSISLNPPQDQHVSREAFEQAADQIEAKVGLSGHPRAIVFHEKEGRRHAHAVWSRIDSEAMRAKNMGFYKHKLMDVSRDLYLQHGWDMPKGMLDHNLRNPLNFTHAQWQQSKRTNQDPRLIKAAIQHCWKNSDNHHSLKSALEDKGFFLAQGDRRAVVAIDVRGETYSLSRMTGVKVKDVRARIGDTKALPSVDQTKQRISDRMTDTLNGYLHEVRAGAKTLPPGIAFKLEQMVARHREERKATWARHEQRDLREKQVRAARLPKGFSGIWSRITGKFSKIKMTNEMEALQCWQRDVKERNALYHRQLDERVKIQKLIHERRKERAEEIVKIHKEIAAYIAMKRGDVPSLSALKQSPEKAKAKMKLRARERGDETRARDRQRERTRGRDPDRGPRF